LATVGCISTNVERTHIIMVIKTALQSFIVVH